MPSNQREITGTSRFARTNTCFRAKMQIAYFVHERVGKCKAFVIYESLVVVLCYRIK